MNTYTALKMEDKTNISFRSKFSELAILMSLTILTAYLVCTPYETQIVILKSLSFCYKVIVPSLFPFLVFSAFICKINLSKYFPLNMRKWLIFFQILVSNLSGFPSGGKMFISLYKQGYVSKEECSLFSGFSNNASPAFVICAIGINLFGNLKIGLVLFICQFFTSILAGLIIYYVLNFKKRSLKFVTKESENYSKNQNVINPFLLLPSTISDATISVIKICGFVIFFDILLYTINAQIIKLNLSIFFSIFISIFTELTNACTSISSLNLPLVIKLFMTYSALSWGGFSSHMQFSIFANEENIPLKYFYMVKTLSFIISIIACFTIYIFMF